MASQHFTLAEFLSPDEAARFLELAHAQQVARVAEYLRFLGRQPAPERFSASRRAAVAQARLRAPVSERSSDVEEASGVEDELVRLLLQGVTRSGFGAFGTEAAFLPQTQLSLQVAGVVEEIGHEYKVEKSRKDAKPVLNSRSFFFYWCHAEKQKLVDVRQKLARLPDPAERKKYWEAIEIVVDRVMCDDCVAFCAQLAKHEGAKLRVVDPQSTRVFPPRPVNEQ